MPFSIVEFGRCLKTSLIVGLFSNLKLLYFVCIAELLLNVVFLSSSPMLGRIEAGGRKSTEY